MMIKNVLKVSAIMLVLGITSGCVGLPEIKRAQAAADSAARAAAAAQSMAETARATADSSAQAAANAQSTADQALSTATEAQTCCDDNRNRLERIFQKTISK
jgi:Flp pilus assembly protein TadG